MDTFSQHLLVEYHGCDSSVLDQQAVIESLLNTAARAAGATVVASTFHRFAPQGVSGVVVVEESHLSIHTWPEAGYAAVDFFTCGEECIPEQAHVLIRQGLGARRAEVLKIRRGTFPPGPSMEMDSHYQESVGSDSGSDSEDAQTGFNLQRREVAASERGEVAESVVR